MKPNHLVTAIATTLVLTSAVVIAAYVSHRGFDKIVPQSIRFGLTVLLAYSLIKGWTPGRWITVVLLGLAGAGAIVAGVGLLNQAGAGLWLIALGSVYLACFAGLLTPLSSKHFGKAGRAWKRRASDIIP